MAEKNLVYRGKSKDVFDITEGPYTGKYRLVFKDEATGYIKTENLFLIPDTIPLSATFPEKVQLLAGLPLISLSCLKTRAYLLIT